MEKLIKSTKNIYVVIKNFLKMLDAAISKCFKKNRNRKKKNKKIQELYFKKANVQGGG